MEKFLRVMLMDAGWQGRVIGVASKFLNNATEHPENLLRARRLVVFFSNIFILD